MNIFADFHHGDLYHSLHFLFEKRLGHSLYRPIGLEWFNDGYWKIAEPYRPNHMPTVQQFLSMEPQIVPSFTNCIDKTEDDIYYCWQPSQEIHHKAITLDKFKEMDIDILISSIPAHDVGYADLIKKYKPQAKHISQMGNMWANTHVKNVMCSFPPPLVPVSPNQNIIFYNQEFDLNIFRYAPPIFSKKIVSFVNCLPQPELYYRFKTTLSDFEFKAFGSCCPDECITPLSAIAKIMQDAMWGYHVKPGGDGYGHCLHNFLAVGRPLIIDLNYYKRRTNLLIPGETCIDISAQSFEKTVQIIREYSEPDIYTKMCQNVHKVFTENVDFNKDADDIEIFLNNLL